MATIRVRYFAAAKHAAGVAEETRTLAEPTTLEQLASELVDAAHRASPPRPELASVLGSCGFFVNEENAVDRTQALHDGDLVDVLPPFAGG